MNSTRKTTSSLRARNAVLLVVSSATPLTGAACSLLSDTNGLSGRDSAALDAALDDHEALPDAITPEVAADVGPPAASFCADAGTVVFCDDFERNDLAGLWTPHVTDGGAVTMLSEPGNRFLHAMVAASAGDVRAAVFRAQGATPAKYVKFGFRARAAQWSQGNLTSMDIQLGDYPSNSVLALKEVAGGFLVFEQNFKAGGYQQYSLAKPTPLGVFNAFELRIAFDVDPPRIDVLVNGENALSTPSQTAVTPAALTFVLGYDYSVPTPDAEIDVDDVLIDYE